MLNPISESSDTRYCRGSTDISTPNETHVWNGSGWSVDVRTRRRFVCFVAILLHTSALNPHGHKPDCRVCVYSKLYTSMHEMGGREREREREESVTCCATNSKALLIIKDYVE
jgi:hypothetical protein